MTLITENLRDIAGVPDNTSVYFTTMVREGSDDDSVLTPRRVSVKPVNGALSVELDPGPASVTINTRTYLFTVPETDSRLWPLIEAAVAIPPTTSAQRLAAALADYFAANPPAATQVEFHDNLAAFPVSGDDTREYVAEDTGKIYRWNGTTYVELSAGQPPSANLSALAGLVSAADTLAYFTGAGAAALTTLSAFARTILDDADAAAVRATIGAQASDAELSALAALVSAADKLPYFTGSGAAALADLTAFARTLLDDPDAATMRATLGVGTGSGDVTGPASSTDGELVLFNSTTGKIIKRSNTITGLLKAVAGVVSAAVAGTDYYNPGGTDVAVADGGTGASTASGARTNLGLVIGTDVQAQDAELAALAALVSAANKLPYFTGSGSAALADLTAFARTLLDDADAATMRATLGLVIGTDVQAQDAELAAIAGLVSAADRLPYFTGSGAAALATFTAAGRALVDDADAAAQRTTLGLGSAAVEAAATAGTANTVVKRDANGNVTNNAVFQGFATTATAAGTTTLDITSQPVQIFTGVTTQTVKLGTTSVPQGAQTLMINLSTGAVTVQSSGANTIIILAPGTSALFTARVATPTAAADWDVRYFGGVFASGKSLTVNSSLTLVGTDGTTMTFPGASDTVAGLAAVQTITGAWSFNDGKLILNGATSGSTTLKANPTASGTITLPAATDTLVGRNTVDTLTNKRITARIGTTASSATPTADADSHDQYNVTALAANATFGAPTGTPTDGQKLMYRIKDNGTARTLAFNAIFRAIGVTLPTTTVISKTLYIGTVYNAADSKWDVLAVGQEA